MSKIYRVEFIGTHAPSGQAFMCHVHYQTDVPLAGTEPTPDTVLDAVLAHYSSSGHNMSKWSAVMDTETSLVRAVAREEVAPGSGDLPGIGEEDLNITGTLTAPTVNQNPVALCAWIRFRTGIASRSARGGTHSPPVLNPTSLSSAGNFTTGTWWTNIGLLSDAIRDALEDVFQTTGDINPVVYSRTRRERGQTPYVWDIVETDVSLTPRWLRRRMAIVD